ncbi:MAG: prephenate dehydratase [Bacteroidota bacterium]
MTTVVFQGEPGAFSEQAAKHFFGRRARLMPVDTFRDVFALVSKKRSHSGIIPIENSLYGSIHENYDLLVRHHLSIIGEIKLRIQLHLLALPGATRGKLRAVYSQAQALGQCEEFLRSLKRVRVSAFHDTAAAARMVSEQHDATVAAIASEQAAKIYGLRILTRNVESNHHNYTRFIVLGARPTVPTSRPKTSLVFAVRNIPGALFRALAVFSLRDINLLKIESRPRIGKPWEYLFYLDVSGRPTEEPLRQALGHLREFSVFVRILGTYTQASTTE